ncbi:hypothetical protein MLD38_040687 [Melastoma candidum]|nr:hypothetical protein MLD38_040687 [Melastoma candidum]
MTPELQLGSDNFIIAMDLSKTSTLVMDLPDGVDPKTEMDVAAVDGRLCLVVNGVDICVWVMGEYGNKDSWSKLFSIPQPEERKPDHFIKPLAHSKDRRKILVRQDSKNLIWYDLTDDKIEEIKIEGMPKSFEAEVCLSTLVPVDDHGNASEEKPVAIRDDFLSEGFRLVLWLDAVVCVVALELVDCYHSISRKKERVGSLSSLCICCMLAKNFPKKHNHECTRRLLDMGLSANRKAVPSRWNSPFDQQMFMKGHSSTCDLVSNDCC